MRFEQLGHYGGPQIGTADLLLPVQRAGRDGRERQQGVRKGERHPRS
jgi:hypothetical protein